MSTQVPATGEVRLSNLRDVFNGTNPVFLSKYYTNASPSLTSGVSGIPASGTAINVSMFRGKRKPVGNGLYSFSTHTFTNAGVSGRNGPTLSQIQSSYSGITWAQNTSYLNMTTQGIQLWTVPATGNYTIDCYGASGGTTGSAGGRGARIRGDFNLTAGQTLGILVGQQGTINSATCNAGGGGGTFVWNTASTSEPLIVAGGGGGGHNSSTIPGLDASLTTSGTGSHTNATPGTNGNGANPGASGWKSNGRSGLDGNNSGCTRPLEGGIGGLALATTSVGNGGFGGGASASGQNCSNGGPGGGGGYSGGAGPSTTTETAAGGGGGSYNSGSNPTNSVRSTAGDGYVIITANFSINSGFTVNLTNINTYHTSSSSAYYQSNISSYYNYTYDTPGATTYRDVTIPAGNYAINDGANDMFDVGNAITFLPNGNTTTAILYGTISNDTNTQTGFWVASTGTWPHFSATWTGSTSRALTICVTGNSGSDGSGTVSNQFTSYTTSSGRNGNIYISTNFGIGDPAIGEVWFTITNTSWGSSVSLTSDGRRTSDNEPTNGDVYSQFMTLTGTNFILCKALLSKFPTANLTTTEVANFVSAWVQNMPANCFT